MITTVLWVGIRGFERRLERMVEGTFSRLFRSGLRPVELGRRLIREIDANRSVGVNGKLVAPNYLSFELAEEDADRFGEMAESLRRELADLAREHARSENCSFMGLVVVKFAVDPRLKTGNFRVVARIKEGEGGFAPGSLLLPEGERVALGESVVSVGRLGDSTLVFEDPSVSRNHAEIRPSGTGFKVLDLGSTNGTFVNGERVSESQLSDGDLVEFGSISIRFEAS